jgi:hypothetical protein
VAIESRHYNVMKPLLFAIAFLVSTIVALHGQTSVAITEFLAKNRTTLPDGTGQFSDWLELHNSGTEPIDLTGWFLTDDAENLTKWEFPDATINPNQFLVVFASNRNEENAGPGNLHTNFQLSGAGEYLALVAKDGTTIIDQFTPSYPTQTSDVSYGRDSNSDTIGFFDSPTPGQANGAINMLGKTITFSHPGGTFADAFGLTFQADLDEGDQIQYTTNGAVPTLFNGKKANAGDTITISANTHIRAQVTNGRMTGPFANAIFLKIDTDLSDFSSNLPLVVIDTLGKRIPPTSSATLIEARTLILDVDSESGRTEMSSHPHYTGKCGLRIRGRSSSGFPKKQYKFEFWDADDNETNFNLFGMGGESDWVLSAPYTDKSLLRNVLTYDLWEEAGWTTLNTRFVEVFINGDGDDAISFNDDYLGVYVFTEGITIDDDRFDMQPPENTVNSEEITGGFIMETGNPGGSHFTTRTSDKNIPYRHKDPNINKLNTEQRSWIRGRIEEFEEALFAKDYRHPDTGQHYSELTDLLSQADYRIFREWTRNFDGGSTYFTLPRGGVITMGPLWDYNWALGNVNYAEGGDVPGYVVEGWNRSFTGLPSWPSWPFRLEQDPDYWQMLTERWFELREDLLATENVDRRIDEMAALLEESAERNFNKWKILGILTNISPPGFRDRKTYQSEIDFLKDWLARRMAWIDSAFPQKPNLTQNGGLIAPDFLLNMASPDGPVYYTTDGSDPRTSGGFPSRDAIQFEGGPIDIEFVMPGANVRYWIPTDDSFGESWKLPEFDDSTWKEAPSPLGFETPGGPLEAAITSDIKAEMRGVNASVYVRHSFEFDNEPSNANSLRMRIRYDDTFVAWLNGVEIARDPERTPEEITWESFAVKTRSDNDALEDLVIDLNAHKDLLRRGNNVLAVQAMNTSAGSSDLIIGASLDGNHSVAASALVLSESTLIFARTRQDQNWSIPVRAYFSVGEALADSSNVVVSEIMYHPSEPSDSEIVAGYTNENQFEFMELHNIGAQTVNLFDLVFSDGINFEFRDSDPPTLGPGDYGIVVSDRAAFEKRYGTGKPILGQFEGNLGNRGERIELMDILSIEYSDEWHPSSDGGGFSLVLSDDSQVPADWNVADTWQAGTETLGTPGRGEGTHPSSVSYSDWLILHFSREEITDASITDFAGDPDQDGQNNLVEYATRTDPRSGLVGKNGPLSVNRESISGIRIRYRKNRAADGITYAVEKSNDLIQWTDQSQNSATEVDNGDGSITISFMMEGPAQVKEQYIRLKLTHSE